MKAEKEVAIANGAEAYGEPAGACYFALVCDSEYPEGCKPNIQKDQEGNGFLINALSFGLIIFCTFLKL